MSDLRHIQESIIDNPDFNLTVRARRDLRELCNEVADRIAELEQQNTFWACKHHRLNNTLRCAICDEERLSDAQIRIEKLEGSLGLAEDQIKRLRGALEKIAGVPHLDVQIRHHPNFHCPICTARKALEEETS